MLRKTKPTCSIPSYRASSPRLCSPSGMPCAEEPLSLVCGACGTVGRYDVGTVTIDTRIVDLPDQDAFERAVGFTAYFRCRECDAGGPWGFPNETAIYLTAMLVAATSEVEGVPLVFGCTATFDKHIFQYATDGEAHLKKLIDREPERAFLWVRLGNLYSRSSYEEGAQEAYGRAIELDPTDIEAHGMLGRLLIKAGRPLEAVPNWHAVLKHVRDAQQVNKEFRRDVVRVAIECLLDAHAESNGQFDLLPTMDPAEMMEGREYEPLVLELREFNLSSEKGISDLCDKFLEQSRCSGRDLFRHRTKWVLDAPDVKPTKPIRHKVLTVSRNSRCPCGSGHKYKKCCGQ